MVRHRKTTHGKFQTSPPSLPSRFCTDLSVTSHSAQRLRTQLPQPDGPALLRRRAPRGHGQRLPRPPRPRHRRRPSWPRRRRRRWLRSGPPALTGTGVQRMQGLVLCNACQYICAIRVPVIKMSLKWHKCLHILITGTQIPSPLDYRHACADSLRKVWRCTEALLEKVKCFGAQIVPRRGRRRRGMQTGSAREFTGTLQIPSKLEAPSVSFRCT